MDDPYSSVTFSLVGSVVAGLITTSAGPIFRLRPYDGKIAIVEQLDPKALGELGYVDDASNVAGCASQEKQPTKLACPIDSEDSEEIHVMVLFTPLAKSWAGGTEEIFAWISLAENRTNQSFAQSGVRHRIKVVRRELVQYEESMLETETDLGRLIAGSDGLEDVHALRDNNHADLTILVVSNERSPGKACELGKSQLKSTTFAAASYGVVAIQWLAFNDIFTHELGHIMGAGHPEKQSGGASGYGRGYSATANKLCPAWRSIMDRMGSGDAAPILYWSNMNTRGCAGQSMGIADYADNARTLNLTACTVASFR